MLQKGKRTNVELIYKAHKALTYLMRDLRIKQMNDGVGYVRGIFGRDVPAILTDIEGRDLWVYSNRPLSGYQEKDGVYFREFDPTICSGEDLIEIGADWRFLSRKIYSCGIPFARLFRPIEIKIGIPELEAGEVGYAKVASIDFASSLGAYREFLEFSPEDALLAHECSHGISGVREDILTKYGPSEIVGEALAAFVERSYIQQNYPGLVEGWTNVRKNADTDHVHQEAFSRVRENSLPFEEIIGKLRYSSFVNPSEPLQPIL